jgi:uncharacterized membrane protein YeaQ/YmgE (transglycosylase-associated protein family)
LTSGRVEASDTRKRVPGWALNDGVPREHLRNPRVDARYLLANLLRSAFMTITGVLSWIIFGLIVGAIARLLMPGRQNMGWVMTIILGIVGSFAGGAISALIFSPGAGLVHPSGWIMSIVGALIVLFVYSRLSKGSSR